MSGSDVRCRSPSPVFPMDISPDDEMPSSPQRWIPATPRLVPVDPPRCMSPVVLSLSSPLPCVSLRLTRPSEIVRRVRKAKRKSSQPPSVVMKLTMELKSIALSDNNKSQSNSTSPPSRRYSRKTIMSSLLSSRKGGLKLRRRKRKPPQQQHLYHK